MKLDFGDYCLTRQYEEESRMSAIRCDECTDVCHPECPKRLEEERIREEESQTKQKGKEC